MQLARILLFLSVVSTYSTRDQRPVSWMLHSEYHPLRRVSLWSLLVPTPYELFESLTFHLPHRHSRSLRVDDFEPPGKRGLADGIMFCQSFKIVSTFARVYPLL